MKSLLFALALATSSFLAYGQVPVTIPKPKDNLVLIQTSDSATTALKKLASAFVAQGYTVDKLDTQFLTLTIAPKTLSTSFDPILLARASATPGANTKLQLTGEYRAMVMGHSINGSVEVNGSDKGVAMSGFHALERIALAYPSGQVSYGKQ